MPESSFNNSPSTAGTDSADIESGTIANVNVRNLTVDWVSQYTGKQIPDLQIMTPYLHYNNGEGFTCVPEVGAICVVCFPSDEESPFVMGFLAGPELEGAEFGRNINKFLTDPGVDSEEDVPPAKSTTSTGSTKTPSNASDASFRAGRPVLNPGDMLWQGRDENFVALRRGGVLQIGATQIAQRAYIPLLNYIRDFCENYELNSAAGSLSWTVQRQENDPAGKAPSELQLIAREYAQDKKASIKVSLGSLDDATKPPGGDKTFVELTIAPQQINPEDGSISGKPKYVLRLDKAGNTFLMQAKNKTEQIDGDYKLTIKGKQEVEVSGNRTVTVKGNDSKKITGTHSEEGTVSKETWSGIKTIGAKLLRLGGEDAVEPAVLGLKLTAWLASHTHKVPKASSGLDTLISAPPDQAGGVTSLISKKVLVGQ